MGLRCPRREGYRCPMLDGRACSGTPLFQVLEPLQRAQIRSPAHWLAKGSRQRRQRRRFGTSPGGGLSSASTTKRSFMTGPFPRGRTGRGLSRLGIGCFRRGSRNRCCCRLRGGSFGCDEDGHENRTAKDRGRNAQGMTIVALERSLEVITIKTRYNI